MLVPTIFDRKASWGVVQGSDPDTVLLHVKDGKHTVRIVLHRAEALQLIAKLAAVSAE